MCIRDRVELALSEVARRENINITDEELEQEYAQLSKEYQVCLLYTSRCV